MYIEKNNWFLSWIRWKKEFKKSQQIHTLHLNLLEIYFALSIPLFCASGLQSFKISNQQSVPLRLYFTNRCRRKRFFQVPSSAASLP